MKASISKFQRRFYIGLTLLFALSILSYQFSIKRAIHEYKESKRFETLSGDIEDLESQILYWKGRNLELGK
mgnify:FL=1